MLDDLFSRLALSELTETEMSIHKLPLCERNISLLGLVVHILDYMETAKATNPSLLSISTSKFQELLQSWLDISSTPEQYLVSNLDISHSNNKVDWNSGLLHKLALEALTLMKFFEISSYPDQCQKESVKEEEKSLISLNNENRSDGCVQCRISG